MSIKRRLLLLSPVIVLTLCLVICGWRSWSLSNDDEEVWLLIADNFPTAGQRIKPAFLKQDLMPRPFHPQQLTILGAGIGEWDSTPLPEHLLKEIRARHRGSRIVNPSKETHPRENWWEIHFKPVRFKSRYFAFSEIAYFSSKQGPYDCLQTGIIRLERSPIPFTNSKWHIVEYIPGTPFSC